jgi:predicted ATPase
VAIKSIRFSNFKSFAETELQLRSFNVIVGSNASGKSNLVSALRFLRDTAANELDNAISLQGGIKYLRNIKIGPTRPLTIELVTDRKREVFIPTKEAGHYLRLNTDQITHKLMLTFKKRRLSDYEVAESLVEMTGQLETYKAHADRFDKIRDVGVGTVRFQLLLGKPFFNIHAPDLQVSEQSLFVPYLPVRETKRLVYGHVPLFFEASDEFRDIALYDFDTKLPKKAVPITPKADLSEDGSNLALVLRSVTEDSEKNRMFSNLFKALLPFIDKVGVDKFADKSMLFKVRERYFGSEFLPASLVSDGTISIAALILALYFGTKTTIILEEPERNIHPSLIAGVVEMMKDASRTRQIILTTHNPEVVKHAGIENLFLISRDSDGFSTLVRPSDKEQVQSFLKSDIGVDDLFASNLLDA